MISAAQDWRARLPARAGAPAKVNLGLFVGRARADGRHELATVMQSISLQDELTLSLAPEGARADEVLCPALPGPASENLAWRALRAFRERTGWDGAPLRLSIQKSIPVAAGLGGGSADAAGALRLARHVSGLGDEDLLLEIAATLGADVPAQVSPGRWLAGGAGEELEELPASVGAPALLVLPCSEGLSTGAVYAQADRLGVRDAAALAERRGALRDAWSARAVTPAAEDLRASALLDNDLQAPALALCPRIEQALTQARLAGADRALVSGSGPTVVGLFADAFTSEDGRGGRGGGGHGDGLSRARAAAEELRDRLPSPICAVAVSAEAGRACTLAE